MGDDILEVPDETREELKEEFKRFEKLIETFLKTVKEEEVKEEEVKQEEGETIAGNNDMIPLIKSTLRLRKAVKTHGSENAGQSKYEPEVDKLLQEVVNASDLATVFRTKVLGYFQ